MPLVMYHDDSCGELLDKEGMCPKCKYHPDMQSTAFTELTTGEIAFHLTMCSINGKYCQKHDFVHGAEAEKLRRGIEKLMAKIDDGPGDYDIPRSDVLEDLQKLLDETDARDSLAYCESTNPKTKR